MTQLRDVVPASSDGSVVSVLLLYFGLLSLLCSTSFFLSFGFACKKYDPIKDLHEDDWNKLGLETRYYNTDLHKGSFYLPTYVKELLGTE